MFPPLLASNFDAERGCVVPTSRSMPAQPSNSTYARAAADAPHTAALRKMRIAGFLQQEVDIVRYTTYRATVNMAAETDTSELPVRQMLDRGNKTLKTVLCKAGSAAVGPLQTSTNEVGYLMEAARLAIESLEITADVTEKKLYEARLRGLSRMADLRRAAEPVLETGQVCDILGVSRETIRKKVDRKQLLALPKGGDRVFPACQFKDGDVVPGLRDVLAALDTKSPFVALSFLLSKDPSFGGKTAIELLQKGDLEPVMAEARGFLHHGS